MQKKKPNLTFLASCAAAFFLATTAYPTQTGYSVGLNFGANEFNAEFWGELMPDAVAGVPGVKQANWNNLFDPIGTESGLVADDRGNPVNTAMEVEWWSNSTWATMGVRADGENNGLNFFPGTPDQDLMVGYLDTTGAATPTLVTITGIPNQLTSSGYHLYIYAMGAHPTQVRGGFYRVLDDQGNVLKPYLAGTTLQNPTGYVRDPGLSHAHPADAGTYLLFENLASPNIVIEATIAVPPGFTASPNTPRAPINAVQLVAADLDRFIVGEATATPQSVTVLVTDIQSSILDAGAVTAILNGEEINVSAVKDGNLTRISYDIFAAKSQFFPAGVEQTVELSLRDTGGNAVTANRNFTLPAYSTITPLYAMPPGSVDTASSGFTAWVHQADPPATLVNSTARGEAQIRGMLIDPSTGQPYQNVAIPGSGPGGSHIIDDYINWNQDAPGAIGNFHANNGFEDRPIPGIPGETGSTDNIAAEIIGYLELPAGAHILGVNSDDGFRLTTAINNARDFLGLQLGVFDGGRGSADSIFHVAVQESGIYPVRLLWYEGSGGANVEFFSVDPVTGEKILVNDRNNPNALKSYRLATVPNLPMARNVHPIPNATGVNGSATILIELQDQDTAVVADTVKLSVNGNEVNATVTKSGNITFISYTPESFFAAGAAQDLGLTFNDNASPANTINRNWSFTVQNWSNFIVVPSSYRAPAGAVDLTKPGFRAKMNQRETARPSGNNLPSPILQARDLLLDGAGEPFENLISVDHWEDDGKWDGFVFLEDDVINYDERARTQTVTAGNFGPDKPIPGIPGWGSVEGGLAHIAMEATTFLELKRGIYRMGVNSDDGFLVWANASANDAMPTQLGVFDGGRGSANTFFDFIIEEDGFYPFTLFWWEGTGGANVEWFNDDGNTGQRILINDRTNPNAIKAYREGASRPYISSAAPHDLLSTFTHWDNPMIEVPLDATVQLTLLDGSTQLDPASVQMTINGGSVTPVVNKSGNTTTVQYNPGGLDPATRYVIGLSYADNSNPPVTRTAQWLFWTTFEGIFTSDTFFIETEDFNYEGGQFRPEANSPTYSGGAYADLVPLLGVDYNEVLGGDDPANAGTQYRNIPTENIRVGMATIGDNQRGPDRVLTTDYKVGWNDNGDWYNFTRDFPAGAYNVFGRLSSGTANINSIHAQLLEVTSDPAQPDQTTQLLGTFRWRKSGGWNTFITVPLLDQSGNIATVNLDGQTTVRLAIQPGNLDSNYLAFVPTDSDPDPANPVFSSFQLQGGNIILEWTGGGALQRAGSILGPWENVSNAGTPASIPLTGPSSFFRILR